MDILFIKLGALGDVINTLPLAVNLKKHFNARIHWLIEPLSYPLVSNHTCVDRTILFDKYRWRTSLGEVRRQVRKIRYDVTLDLQRILKSGLLSMMANTGRRIGFDKKRCKEMTWIFPFERIPPADPGKHMLSQYQEFAHYLGVSNFHVRWDIPVAGKGFADLPAEYIVLNIGATKSANKWYPDRFASLAETVMKRYNVPAVITGGPEDRQGAEQIRAAANCEIVDLVGKTSLKDLIEVLNGSKAVVSCDTGPMHLAVALGKEVIALFGPANPRRTGPFRGRVIQKYLDCSPCNLKRCKDRACMDAISAGDVMERIEEILPASSKV